MRIIITILVSGALIWTSCNKKKASIPPEDPAPVTPVQTASTYTITFALVDNTNPMFPGTYSSSRKMAFVKSGNTIIDSVLITSSIYADNGSADYCALSTSYTQTSVVKTQGAGNRIYLYEGTTLLADAELKAQNGGNILNDIKGHGNVDCFSVPGCLTLLVPIK